MRKTAPLDALMPATRQRILSATLLRPDKWWYLSDLAKHLGVRPSSLQRELASLVDAGILENRREGNRVYFRPAPNCPFLAELTGVIAKTAGVNEVLRRAIRALGRQIELAFVYGSLARGEFRPDSDIDLMVVGDIGLANLAKPLKKAENQLGRPINPTVYPREELVSKLESGHHFLSTVLKEPKLFIIGDQDELDEITSQQPRAAAHHHQERNRRSSSRRRP